MKVLEKSAINRVTPSFISLISDGNFLFFCQQLLSELDKVKKEKADADERLRKVQLETMHVQQNLNVCCCYC